MNIPPLFPLSLMLILGIVVGKRVGELYFWSIYVVLASLLLAALLRSFSRLATVMILVSVFFLGGYLIGGKHRHYTMPFEEQITERMMAERASLARTYERFGLQGDELAVVTAMTLGERSKVNPQLRERYNVSGAAHVFALSGMHLGIIFMLLTMLVPRWGIVRFGRWRKPLQAFLALFQVFTLWAYVLLVGAHPSVMRAAVMLTVYTVARNMSRHPDALSVLVLSLMLLLVVWPEWLFDVGFQMSFAAVFSIVLMYNPLNLRLTALLSHKWYTPPLRITLQTLLLSTCAQVGVAPLVAYYFHRFSTYFLLTNLPVPLLAAAIIYLSVGLLVAAQLSLSVLAGILAAALQYTAHALNQYLSWIAHLPFASIDNIRLSTAQLFLLYIIIICVYMIARKVKKQ